DPVWITFDHWGRMFVAEYADYPNGPVDQRAPPLSRIVMLEDSDGDTGIDRRYVFAEQLNYCHSIMAFRDGLLAGTKEAILYLKDSDWDHKADVREVLFGGFQSPHPQMQIGCPQWGIDNWI
ncbi:MAG TPA: dehydrogenase, partial [Planctomycetaceae bacterium]|nr:dehydrogenase [Planctomycetaceae bacterium]